MTEKTIINIYYVVNRSQNMGLQDLGSIKKEYHNLNLHDISLG